ncbi:MAG TPA: asparagine synthase (glutamine-hydrolyzing) [Blastocatellia bacterium]|nr:asparagine synthase (glutamine-hydrolyzing) [Blastocatellia bacterium]
MCGICGIVIPNSNDARVDRSRLVGMTESLIHRGPDDNGIFLNRNVGLGHRRLSIVDVAGGRQPMTNEDGTVWIVYNGEIYNHLELRPGLEHAGHRYRSNTDTETIIHLYEELGDGFVNELRGMFALALYDARRDTILLARDRLGIKPLYYHLDREGRLVFASEIKAILESGNIRASLNYAAVPDYLANHAPSGEDTLFEGIKRLRPAHILKWESGRITKTRYWTVSFQKPEEPGDKRQYVAGFKNLFEECVGSHLMSDVPLGMFLSGGIDSSAIAAVMSGMVREPIKTFSVAFEESEANELEFARLVSRRYATDHHEVTVTPGQFFDAMDHLVYHEDEPIAHPSSIPLYFLSRLASEHVKVVLTGEGSDELLAGYGRYRKTIYNMKIGSSYHKAVPQGLRRLIRRALVAGAPGAVRRKLNRTFLCLDPRLDAIYLDNFSVFSRAAQEHLLSQSANERTANINPYDQILECMSGSNATSLLDGLLSADIGTYLHELLMKQDQMSMAASIESRVPFLDHKLVEYACALPDELKLNGLTTKYILREAMQGQLPPEILRRRKMGFPVPLGKWLRGTFTNVLDEYLLSPRFRDRGVFKTSYVSELVLRHRQGENHSERLWALLNFEVWMRRFIDADHTGWTCSEPAEQAMPAKAIA